MLTYDLLYLKLKTERCGLLWWMFNTIFCYAISFISLPSVLRNTINGGDTNVEKTQIIHCIHMNSLQKTYFVLPLFKQMLDYTKRGNQKWTIQPSYKHATFT